MRFKLAVGILGAAMLAVVTVRGGDGRQTVESIGERVMCLCGCVAILNHCPHNGCSTHEEMRAAIQKAISEGKGETAILQDLTLRYGVQVLAAPPVKGFNLTAWVLPGLGLIVGLVLVVAIVRRWRRPAEGPSVATPAPVDPKVLAAVEEEMKSSGLGAAG